MGSWWRSEDMSFVSLILPEEAAVSCVRELGSLGCIQFTDLNPELTPFQRRYVAFVKRYHRFHYHHLCYHNASVFIITTISLSLDVMKLKEKSDMFMVK